MKRTLYIMAMTVLSVIALASCQKENGAGTIVDGDWHGSMTVSEETVADVYISFSEGNFVIYQKTGSLERYYMYDGTYTVTGNTLSGKYSDGTSWGSQYEVNVTGNSMQMTALNGSGEVSIYQREEIPAEVKDTAVPNVKSDEPGIGPVL